MRSEMKTDRSMVNCATNIFVY